MKLVLVWFNIFVTARLLTIEILEKSLHDFYVGNLYGYMLVLRGICGSPRRLVTISDLLFLTKCVVGIASNFILSTFVTHTIEGSVLYESISKLRLKLIDITQYIQDILAYELMEGL